MDYLLLGVVLLCAPVTLAAQKQYTLRNRHPAASAAFNLEMALVMLAGFWLINGFRFTLHLPTLWYALAFALGFSAFAQFSIKAIGSGPLGVTNLLLSFSLIVPALAGVLLWGEPVTPGRVAGLALLLLSLVLLNLRVGGEGGRANWKWALYVLIAFCGNGTCSLTQKMHQRAFPEQYRSEFMMLAMAAAALLSLPRLLAGNRKGLGEGLKRGWIWTVVYGAANTVVNYLVMVLCVRMNASVLFPSIAAGGILLNLTLALTVYRERLTRSQAIAFAVGTVSIVLLNL